MYPVRIVLGASLGLLALGLLPSCDPLVLSLDQDTIPTSPAIELQPELLEFGDVAAGLPSGQGLRLFNHGTQAYRVLDVELIGDDGWRLETALVGQSVAPGESVPLEVWFDPLLDGPQEAALLVTTDIAGQRQALLTANGLAPRLVVDPPSLAFEDVAVGCAHERSFAVHNAGSMPLTISDVDLFRKSAEIDLTSHLWLPAVVAPGESTWLRVAYRPQDDAVDVGSVVITTDAPAAADEVVPIEASAVYPAPVEELFVQQGNLQADVLWVVDDAPGMQAAQQAAGLAAWSYVDALSERVDFQLGVISTDEPALLGDTPVLTTQHGNPATAFAGTLQLGTREGEPPGGLSTVVQAVTPPMTDPDGPNFGFLRDDSLLYVVVVSERDDASAGSVMDLVLALKELRPDPDRVVISGVSAFPSCAETPAVRYANAVEATGGQEICLQDLVLEPLTAMEALADDAARVLDTFHLEGEPLEGVLAVTVDGQPLVAGWDYDPASRTVRFEPDHVPDNGQFVGVTYFPTACF